MRAREQAATMLNGYDVDDLHQYVDLVRQDPSQAERRPILTAKWEGGDLVRVEGRNASVHLAGEGEFYPMSMLLASLAACDVQVVATHATLLGLKIEDLTIEAKGHFNVRSFLGIEGAPGSGYDEITYTIRLRAPEATPEQIAHLRERCERSSPVGNSLGRAIPLKLEFVTEES